MNDGGNFISPDEFAFLEDGCLCIGKPTVANVLLSGAKWPSIHLVETVLKAFITNPQKDEAVCRKAPPLKKLLPDQKEKHLISFLMCSRFLCFALLVAGISILHGIWCECSTYSYMFWVRYPLSWRCVH